MRRGTVAAPTETDVGAAGFAWGIAGAVLLAASLQAFFLSRGFLAIGWDEAGRTLAADAWAREGTLTGPWLPFHQIVVGEALRLHRDLVVTPRVVSGAFGLALVGAVAFLGRELYGSRRAGVLAAVAAALFSQRIALANSPLSSISFGFFVVCAMFWLARGSRRASTGDLLAAAASLAVAATIRYEAWVLCGAVALVVLLDPRTHRPATPAALALLALVPSIAAALALAGFRWWAHDGLLGTPYTGAVTLWTRNPLWLWARGLVASGNVVGLIALVVACRRRPDLGRWVLAPALALLLISAGLLVVGRAQSGPAWRMTAVWAFLLLPFTAVTMLDGRWWRPAPGAPWAKAAGASALAVAFLGHAFVLEADSRWAFPESDRRAGRVAAEWLARHPAGRALVEGSTFAHLNLLVASQAPERFEVDGWPEREGAPSIVPEVCEEETVRRLVAEIGLLVYRSPPKRRCLAGIAALEERSFGDWSLFLRRVDDRPPGATPSPERGKREPSRS